MPMTMTTLAAVLIDDRTDRKISDTFNQDVDAWEDFPIEERTFTGNVTILVAKVGRNNSVSSSLDSTEPPAGQQGYLNMTVEVKRMLGKAQWEHLAEISASDAKGSVMVEPKGELDGLIQDFKKVLCAMTFTGGPVMGVVWERKAAGLTYGYRGRSADVQVGAGKTVRFIRLDTYATVGADTQMTAITTRLLTLSANIDTSGVPAGVPIAVVNVGTQATALQTVNGGPVGAFNGDPSGLLTNLCQVSHFGNNRNTDTPVGSARLQSNFLVVGNTNAEAGDALGGTSDMDLMEANIRAASGARPDRYWCSWHTKIAYSELLQGVNAANVRVDAAGGPKRMDPAPPVARPKSSESGLGRGGIPMHCSADCPDGLMFLLTNASFTRVFKGKKEGGWFLENGNPITKTPGRTESESTRYLYHELVCRNPIQNGLIAGIADVV